MQKQVVGFTLLSCLFIILFVENQFAKNVIGQWIFGVLLAFSWGGLNYCVYKEIKDRKNES